MRFALPLLLLTVTGCDSIWEPERSEYHLHYETEVVDPREPFPVVGADVEMVADTIVVSGFVTVETACTEPALDLADEAARLTLTIDTRADAETDPCPGVALGRLFRASISGLDESRTYRLLVRWRSPEGAVTLSDTTLAS